MRSLPRPYKLTNRVLPSGLKHAPANSIVLRRFRARSKTSPAGETARTRGGARFRRLEGCWYDKGKIYFTSTNGGDMGFGQVWMYDVAAESITLVVESSGHDMFDGPDNCCVSACA